MKRTLLLGSAIAVAGLSIGFVGRFRPGRPRTIAPAPVVETMDARRPVPAFDDGARSASESVQAGADAPVLKRFAGVALDLARAPVAGLALGADGIETARTDERGAFAITCTDAPRSLSSLDPHWCTVVAALITPGVEGALCVVVAPARRVGGRVIDGAGAPIAGATLELALAAHDRATALEGLAYAFPCAWNEQSAADGSFAFACGPDGAGVRLRASAAGFHPLDLAVAPGERVGCELRLEREAPPADVLRGRVLHAGGAPAGGAAVRFGSARAYADAEGRFELEVPCRLEEIPLVATLAGFQPAVRERALHRVGSESQSPALELRLGPAALELVGRVQQPDGVPLKGWRVALLDGVLIDPLAPEGDTVERDSARDRGAQRSAADGSFRFGGLSARAYRVAAWRTTGGSLQVIVSAPAPAGGGDVVLECDATAPAARVAVRVVDPLGNPVSDARIGFAGGRAITAVDGDGRFELRGAPSTSVPLLFAGEGIVPAVHELVLAPGESSVDVTVAPQLRLRVSVAADEAGPDAVCALDASGHALAIGSDPTASWLALGGSGRTALVPCAAPSVLSFWRGGRELGTRVPTASSGELEVAWP